MANLQRYRKRENLSQGTVARRASEFGAPMYQQTIAKIEAGQRDVTIDEAHALARAVNRPFSMMFRAPAEMLSGDEAREELDRTRKAIERVSKQFQAARDKADTAKREALAAETLAHDLEEKLLELEEVEMTLVEVVEPRKRGKRQAKN